jgi:hypothetical protein
MKLVIGAPANLAGAGTAIPNTLVYPLAVRFTNLVAHGLNFPEVELVLAACTDTEKSVATVEIKNLAALKRLVSSIEQVAFLNNHLQMLVIEAEEPKPIITAVPIIDPPKQRAGLKKKGK